MTSSKLEEEATAIVITSDDTWVALIKFLLQKISQIRMLANSGLLMHRLFSLPNISGSMISCGLCFNFRRLTMSCSGTIWILFMGTLECARVVEVLLRLTDGSIPAPPFDLVMARAERCTFRDKSGVLVVTPL